MAAIPISPIAQPRPLEIPNKSENISKNKQKFHNPEEEFDLLNIMKYTIKITIWVDLNS